MSRVLENRVTKLEDRRRGAGRFDDWTEEELPARAAELESVLTDNGRIPFEDVIAACDHMNETEKATVIAQHRAHVARQVN